MSSFGNARAWIGLAAAGTTFWIALRVMTASAAAVPAATPSIANPPVEISDPALDAMIARFARSARAADQ